MPQVTAPASRPQRATLPRGCLVIWLALLAGMFILFVIRVAHPPTPAVPQPGSGIDIRANGIAILQMVTQSPYEGIEVFDDGSAIRFPYPVVSGNYTTIELTPEEQQAFAQFRSDWCQHLPTFHALQDREPFYDLGVRCGGYTVKQAKVPVDELPPVFANLRRRLPQYDP
jgi:hypothetical protein